MRLIRRTLTIGLAAAALVAPATLARAADNHTEAVRAHELGAYPEQDLRSPDARDAATRKHPRIYIPPYATVAETQVPAGQPAWPTHPKTLTPPHAKATSTSSDAWPIPVLPIVGFALIAIAAAFGARFGVRRAHRRARIAA
jgi:hypothetical protein